MGRDTASVSVRLRHGLACYIPYFVILRYFHRSEPGISRPAARSVNVFTSKRSAKSPLPPIRNSLIAGMQASWWHSRRAFTPLRLARRPCLQPETTTATGKLLQKACVLGPLTSRAGWPHWPAGSVQHTQCCSVGVRQKRAKHDGSPQSPHAFCAPLIAPQERA